MWKELNYGAMGEKEKQLVVTEVNLLRELRHPFIVRYLDRIIDKQNTLIYIVMENCAGGDLQQLLAAKKVQGQRLEEHFIWKIFCQLLLALKHCHQHVTTSTDGNKHAYGSDVPALGTSKSTPILHRDLKPANVRVE